jgi:hypothetical protein
VRPWIIGETALAGSSEVTNDPVVGTEADQKLFADFTLARSLDCGADGYSWWQYQEVLWTDANNQIDPGNRMGLITRLDDANPANSDRRKPAFSSFAAYPGAIRSASNAGRPPFYGNVDNYPATVFQGKCVDENGNALADAVVRAQRQNENAAYVTFTADDGTYAVKGPASSNALSWAGASKPGYGAVDATANPNHCVLETWRDDSWSRRWVAKTAGQIDYSSTTGFTFWTVDAADRFYIGDFDGDGRDEVLCVKTGGSAGDAMVMLRFDGHWSLVWSNNQSPAAGNGIYPYRFNMVAGDFDGDGVDELLGIGANGDWLTLFRYSNGDWQWIASTSGNTQHALRPYASRLISGRFDGGADLLLGVSSWTTLFQFDTTANDWVWVDSDYGTTNDSAHPLSALRPYVGSVVVGDFDGNGRDEILGFAGTAANSWVTLFGIRSGPLEWLISNYGSSEAVLSGITPYQSRLIAGDFDGDADRVLGLATHATMFGAASEDFARMWGSVRPTLAGLTVNSFDKVFAVKCHKTIPDYLLVIPDATRKASLITFDPVLQR